MDHNSIFAKQLEQAFSESSYALAMQSIKVSTEYQNAQKEYKNMFSTIEDKLGEDRKLMLRLEEFQNHMRSMDDYWIYLQGIIDCAYLMKLIKLI